LDHKSIRVMLKIKTSNQNSRKKKLRAHKTIPEYNQVSMNIAMHLEHIHSHAILRPLASPITYSDYLSNLIWITNQHSCKFIITDSN